MPFMHFRFVARNEGYSLGMSFDCVKDSVSNCPGNETVRFYNAVVHPKGADGMFK